MKSLKNAPKAWNSLKNFNYQVRNIEKDLTKDKGLHHMQQQ